jgi:hypothetical protein
VLGYVDHSAVRIAHEESAQAPLFVGERVDDLGASRASAVVHSIDIVHFDRNVSVDVSLDVKLHHAQLHLALIRPEEDDPIETLATVEADHVVVEGSAFVEALRQDVRLDPPHTTPAV